MATLHRPEPTTQPNDAENPTMTAMPNTRARRAGPRQLAALAGVLVLLLALGTAAALRQAATARPALRAPAASQTRGEDQPALADSRAQHEDLSPAAPASAISTDLPDTPRHQQRLASLDARDNGPADDGAPPPQDDGHNRGPR